jgi:hypothetical protein
MLRRWTGFGAVALCLATAAHGALPPKYQRLRELQAILATGAVAEAFPNGEQIEQIRAIGPDRYRVSSQRCAVEITIVDDPKAPAMPGPRRFLVRTGKAVCK